MRKHCLFVLSVLVVAVIGTAVASSAQERQLGGVGITVFTDSNFRGKSATFREDVSDLVRHGLNDKISSLRVGPGEQWEVCEHTNYQGRCVVVSGEEPELKRHSWSDEISSFRRVGSTAVRPPVRPTPPSQSDYIVLYDQPTYRGNPMNYNGPVSNLAGFRAESLTIGRGVWELCEGPNFTGRCITLDKSVADLNAYGLRNRISSVRPVGSGGSGGVRPPVRPMPQPPQSDWYIVLYDQPMYRGNPMNHNGPVSNLAGFRAGSVTIGKGVWEVCEGPNFRGRCITLDRSVPDLNAYGMRNRVASLRPSGEGGAYVPPTRPVPQPQQDWYIVLYDQPNYRGTPTNYKGAVSYLSGSDRRAQSVTIGRGVWELCEGTNFRGRCVTLDRSVPDLNTYDLSGRVSSVRPVSGQPR